MTTVTGTVVLPDGSAAPGATISYKLVGTNGASIGGTTGDSTVISSKIITAVAGVHSCDLFANADIIPAGTRWRQRISVGAVRHTRYLEVPTSGPVVDVDIETDPPGALGSAALEVAIAGLSGAYVLIPTAARYYVDSANGLDTNDGRSPGAPLKTITAALGSNRYISLAPGGHQLPAGVVLNSLTNVTVDGAGPNATLVVVNGDYDAFLISGLCSKITLKNMWIGSFLARASGCGIKAVATSTHHDNVLLENILIQNTHDGYYLDGVDQFEINHVRVLQSSAGKMLGNGSYFIRCISGRINGATATTTAGTIGGNCVLVDSDCDTLVFNGVAVATSTLACFDLRNSLGAGHTGPRLVRLTNCYAESSLAEGFLLRSGRDVHLDGCHAAVNTLNGFDVRGGTAIRHRGCSSIQNGRHGYSINGVGGDDVLKQVALSECEASNNSQTTHNTYDGLNIAANTNIQVALGRYGDFIFSLTNKQRYGLNIAAATDYLSIVAPDLQGNQTGTLLNASTGTHNNLLGVA